MLAPSCGFHKNAQNLIGTQWYVFMRLPRFPLETTLTPFAHLAASRNSNIATSSQPTTTQPSSWGLSFSWQRWRPAPKDDDDANVTYKVLWSKKRRFCNEVSGSPQIILYLWSDPKSDCLENPAFLSFPRKAVIHQLLSFQPCSSSQLIGHRRRATPC